MSKLLGIIIFLVLLLALNFLRYYIDNAIFSQVVSFVNSNTPLIILIFIFFFFAELFELLQFPLNLPTPLLNALGAIFVVSFIYKLFDFIDLISGQIILSFFKSFSFIIYMVVFLVVLIVGYVVLFMNIKKPSKRRKSSD
jgi:hypothetical protein